MKLADLDPRFIRRIDDTLFDFVEEIDQADGLLFLCPACFGANGGPRGTHSIICWRPRVPLTTSPKRGRWEFEGSGLEDLTLVAGSSSVLLTGGCRAHFFIRNGEVINA